MYLPGLSGIASGFMQGMALRRQEDRQDAADQRAQESHTAQMDTNKQQTKINQQTIDANQRKADQDKEEYQRLHTWQQYAAPLMAAAEAGDNHGALNSFASMANDPVFAMPYKTDFTRDDQGNITIGKDGKAEAIHTWDDGRVQKVMVDPNDVITASMAMYNPAVLAKMRMESASSTAAKQAERKFELKKIGINNAHDEHMAKLNHNYRIGELGIKQGNDLDKPLSSGDIKTLFTKDEVVGKDQYGEPKTTQRMDKDSHRQFIQWVNKNKRQTTMHAYNDWLASTPGQDSTAATQPDSPESKAIAWAVGKNIGTDQSKLNDTVRELRNQKWSDDQILRILQQAGVKLDGDQ